TWSSDCSSDVCSSDLTFCRGAHAARGQAARKAREERVAVFWVWRAPKALFAAAVAGAAAALAAGVAAGFAAVRPLELAPKDAVEIGRVSCRERVGRGV